MPGKLFIDAFQGDSGGYRNLREGEIVLTAFDFDSGIQAFSLYSVRVTPINPLEAPVFTLPPVSAGVHGAWRIPLAQMDGDPAIRQGLHLFAVDIIFSYGSAPATTGMALASARVGVLPRIPRPPEGPLEEGEPA